MTSVVRHVLDSERQKAPTGVLFNFGKSLGEEGGIWKTYIVLSRIGHELLRIISVGISPYRSSIPIGFFVRRILLQKILNRASIPTRKRPHAFSRAQKEEPFRVLLFVLSVGIEPTLQAPQACVLSIERREHINWL